MSLLNSPGKVPVPVTRRVGELTYELTVKKVRNINLRVHPDGTLHVSAPRRVAAETVDSFVRSKEKWIVKALESSAKRANDAQDAQERPEFTDAQCLAEFNRVSDMIYPLFAAVLPQKPLIKARLMKSRWGVCHIAGRYITLNKQLMLRPVEALEYVVMHEYVHFLHPNHQKGFHREMARLMPDYKARRALLR